MTETQETITAWANETFGPIASIERGITRANLEMAEALHELTSDHDDWRERLIAECADVLIVLARVASCAMETVTIPTRSMIAFPAHTLASHALGVANTELARLYLIAAEANLPTTRVHISYTWNKVKAVIEFLGGDAQAAIDAKMAINRARQWRRDGQGHAFHIPEGSAA
ncbi:MAG TPA: hypothetical protein VND94_00705 [Terriglobia bacterium]|nr:hypothetical protein [Terriglobia bacterium]